MLLAVKPLAVVLAAIGPDKDALALFLVVEVLAFIPSAVVPSKQPGAVHLVIKPFTAVLSLVGPCVDALALNVIVEEVTRVG